MTCMFLQTFQRCHLQIKTSKPTHLGPKLSTYHHIDCQFKFSLDNLYQDILRDETVFVSLTSKGYESIQIFIDVTFNIISELLVFVPLDSAEESLDVQFLQFFGV